MFAGASPGTRNPADPASRAIAFVPGVGVTNGAVPVRRSPGIMLGRSRVRVAPKGSPTPSQRRFAMRTRLVLFVAALASAALLVGPVAGASAATKTVPFAKKVAISGTAKNGKSFKGTYTIDRFAKKNGKLYAVGTVKGH